MPAPQPEPLRSFALEIYAREGVSTACLWLQERLDLDVNLLLFGAWSGAERGVRLTAQEVAAARDQVACWHLEIVRGLRAVRRRLKSEPTLGPSEATGVFRAQVQAVEISAELIELDTLGAFGLTLPEAADSADPLDLAAQGMSEVVTLAAGRVPDAEELAAINVLVAACAARRAQL